jgi:hypothetical protein
MLSRIGDVVAQAGEPLKRVHGLDRGPSPASSREVQRPSPGKCTWACGSGRSLGASRRGACSRARARRRGQGRASPAGARGRGSSAADRPVPAKVPGAVRCLAAVGGEQVQMRMPPVTPVPRPAAAARGAGRTAGATAAARSLAP